MARTIYKAKPKGWQVRYAARLAKVTKERAADKCGARQCASPVNRARADVGQKKGLNRNGRHYRFDQALQARLIP